MAAINALVVRDAIHEISKRSKSWPAREPGVMVVFCIVGVVGLALAGLFIQKTLKTRKAKRAASHV